VEEQMKVFLVRVFNEVKVEVEADNEDEAEVKAIKNVRGNMMWEYGMNAEVIHEGDTDDV
jgi:hypothetical protein